MSAANEDRITFPPFPQPPAGVVLVPFKDWEEKAICMDAGPLGAEVDMLGIPTIIVKTKNGHDTDYCKTNTKRKRLQDEERARKKMAVKASRTWWQEWEDDEDGRRVSTVDRGSDRYERLLAAAHDFEKGRKFPITFASETGPNFIWTKFRLFLGVPIGAQISKKTAKKDEEQELSEDEDESDDEQANDNAAGGEVLVAANRKEANVFTPSELQAHITLNKAAERNDARLSSFFADPEAAIRVFMSSYSREKGYIWSPPNLDVIPRVLDFFIRFLLRSKVFPEIDRELQRCLPIIEQGLVELTSTSGIARAFPDKFSLACKSYYGRKANPPISLSLGMEAEDDAVVPEETDSPNPDAEVETEAANIEEISTWGAPAEGSAWGDVSGGWASANGADGWGMDYAAAYDDSDSDDDDDDGGKDKAKANDNDATWGIIQGPDRWASAPESFFPLLGATVLPLTHRTGIVEQSMRRVKAVVPKNNNTPPGVVQAEGAYTPSADGVEAEMDRLFWKVVLSPMPDWDAGTEMEYTEPKILDASRGPVVGQETVDADAASGAAANGDGSNGKPAAAVKPYDPTADDITLLVEDDEAAQLIQEGMGIGGTWVQLVRNVPAAKKKKSKSKKNFNGYWYLEEVAIVTPTFWLARKEN